MSELKLEALISIKNDLRALRRSVKEVNDYKSKLISVRNVFKGGLLGVGFAAGMAGFRGIVRLAEQLPGNILEASIRQERYNKLLKSAFGDQQVAAREMERVRQLSDTYGQNFEMAVRGYSRITAAANGTKMAGEGALDLFESLLIASASEDWSDTEFEGILMAFEQMLSGNTVRAQELYIQLAQRMPQALQLFADAMGVERSELKGMVATGKVLAEEVLPGVSKGMRETFGRNIQDGVTGARASLARFKNQMFEIWVTLGEGGFIDAFTEAVGELAVNMKDPDFQAGVREVGELFGQMALAGSKATKLMQYWPAFESAMRVMNPTTAITWDWITQTADNSKEGLEASLKLAEAEYRKYADQIFNIKAKLEQMEPDTPGYDDLYNAFTKSSEAAQNLWENLETLRERYNTLYPAMQQVAPPGGDGNQVEDLGTATVDKFQQALLELQIITTRKNQLTSNGLLSEIDKRDELARLMRQEIQLLGILQESLQASLEGGELGIEEQIAVWEKLESVLTRIVGLRSDLNSQDFMGSMNEGFVAFTDNLETTGTDVSDLFAGTMSQGIDSAAQSMAALAMQTDDYGMSAQQILQNLIMGLAKMAIQEIILFGIRKVLRKRDTQDTIQSETQKTPSLITNATAASISSYGGAAITGMLLALLAIAAIGAAFRERGGGVQAGEPYIVGEKRPELFIPQTSGYIRSSVPNQPVGQVSANYQAPQSLYFSSKEAAEDYAESVPFETRIIDVVNNNTDRLSI